MIESKTLLDVLQARCHGMRQGEGTSRVQFVKKDIQENGSDCGAWAMYALYTRALKRATRYTRAALFDNMDMTCPRHALNFRLFPLLSPCIHISHSRSPCSQSNAPHATCFHNNACNAATGKNHACHAVL
jgi:hypothetical protein